MNLSTFNKTWIFWPLVLLVAVLGIWLRFNGQDWDEGQLLHPDERFLVMVASSIKAVHSLPQYFDTARSSLSPYNHDFGFYVYGTLPLFLFRYVADAFGSGISIHLIGRSISAGLDFGTCLIVFASAWILFGRWAGLLGFFISATCVLPIQLSHFATFDSHAAFFATLVLFISILIAQRASKMSSIFLLVLVAGFISGLAAASKINLALVFALVPLSIIVATLSQGCRRALFLSTVFSALSLLVLALTFRIFQPYAFSGPGFFDLTLNPQWIDNMKSLAQQAQGALDPPPAVQWYQRTRLHGLINLISWGYGLPMGLFAFGSLLYALYGVLSRGILRNNNYTMPVLWGILALSAYVLGIALQPMRYGAPVYPALTIIVAGVVSSIFHNEPSYLLQRWKTWELISVRSCAALILLSSLLWSIAFTHIYRVDNPRIAASRWMLQEIPSGISFSGRSNHGEQSFPISISTNNKSIKFPLHVSIWPSFNLLANKIFIPKVSNLAEGEKFISEISNGADLLATFEMEAHNGQLQQVLPLPINFKPGANYQLRIKPYSISNAEIKLATLVRESSWDDGLPMRVDGYDPYGGIYDGDLNLEIYWRDKEIKAARMAKVLAQTDYFYLSSNRQVGTVGRLPIEYPIAALLYQKLLGCSAREYIPECYAKAHAGDRNGELGFELIKTFESYPEIFGISFNTQLADEAFQVYDHPRVMIFKNKNKLSATALEKLLTPVRIRS